jgi:hypothetical protein
MEYYINLILIFLKAKVMDKIYPKFLKWEQGGVP